MLSHRLSANGLAHHVLEWPSAVPTPATAVLLHGLADAAATWERVAVRLSALGLRVLAPDFRGFGDGPRVPEGSYYHFPDYVADLAGILEAAVGPAPLFLVGHSMGGSVALQYAGAFPERVTKLALLEGGGPPGSTFEVLPERMRLWIDQVREVRLRGERLVGTLEDAFRRLAANHPGVAEGALREVLPALVREAGEGRVAWRTDSLHRTRSPTPFFAESYVAFARKVACPVLFVSGGPLGLHVPDEEERLAALRSLQRVELAGAGHMMHWTRPEELAKALARFWGAPTAPSSP